MRNAARLLAVGTAAAAALAGAWLPAQAQPGSGDGVVTARGGLTVRTAPTTHATSAGHLARGTGVPVVCRVDGGIVDGDTTWYALPPTTGEWVSGRYLDVAGTVPECGDVQSFTPGRSTTGLTVRRGPSTAEQDIGSVSQGQELQLQCRTAGQPVRGDLSWYKLSRSQGWVAAHYVDTDATPPWCTA